MTDHAACQYCKRSWCGPADSLLRTLWDTLALLNIYMLLIAVPLNIGGCTPCALLQFGMCMRTAARRLGASSPSLRTAACCSLPPLPHTPR